jgi:tetratricopeptide (TPR) repeat protein
LTELAVAPPGEPATEVAVDEVRRALLEIGMGRLAGVPQPVEQLRARVNALLDAQQHCQHDQVGALLPALIRDLHTAANAKGGNRAEALALVPLLHVQGTQAWLRDVGASLDLAWSAVALARQAAAELDDPGVLGVAAFGAAHGLMTAGTFDLAAEQLDDALRIVGTVDSDRQQLTGMLTLTRSLLAAASGHRADVAPTLEQAAELAARTGEGNACWFGFGPTNIGTWEMAVALEDGDHGRAVAVAERLHADHIPSPQRRAAYWADYGRALTRVRGRTDEAVAALRRAELISPTRVHRHPFARETVTELLGRVRRDAVGRELRGIAYRAGVTV